MTADPLAAGSTPAPGDGPGRFGGAAASLIAGLAQLLTGAQARWAGCAPSLAPRIYFANHASHLDFVVLWAALPPALRARTRPVAGRDYWDRGAVRRFLAREVFQAVLVDREAGAGLDREARVEAARRTVAATAAALAGDRSLILFPEGTRGRGGAEVGPFKSGLYFLARELAREGRPAELVPAWLENLNRVLPKGEVLPVPLLGGVTFGPPLPPPAEGEERDAFLERARDAVLALRGRRGT